MATTQPIPETIIGGPSTKELAGLSLRFSYTTGIQYQLNFGSDTLAFTPPKNLPPGPTPPPIHYLARKIREDLYMVHWLIRDSPISKTVIHVAILLDFKEHKAHISAYMPGGGEFFDQATIEKVTPPQ